MRSSIQDLKGFACTPYDLRKHSPWLRDLQVETLQALSDLVDARFLQLVTAQLQVAQFSTLIIGNITAGNYVYTRTTLVKTLAQMLLEYEPHATLAGWPTWLQTVVDYCKERLN